MPNAELILDATEKLISIPFDSNYIISGVVVELCTCTRQMIYQVSDIAYIKDIEALDKKINTLAEVSHNNDVSMASIQESYTTVDEVNEALSNYALKAKLETKITALETENALSKAQLEEIQFTATYSDYIKCSVSFTNQIFDIGGTYYGKTESNTHKLIVYNEASTYKLLFIFTEENGKKYYVEFFEKENLYILDMIYGAQHIRYGAYDERNGEASFDVDFPINISQYYSKQVDDIYYHNTTPPE